MSRQASNLLMVGFSLTWLLTGCAAETARLVMDPKWGYVLRTSIGGMPLEVPWYGESTLRVPLSGGPIIVKVQKTIAGIHMNIQSESDPGGPFKVNIGGVLIESEGLVGVEVEVDAQGKAILVTPTGHGNLRLDGDLITGPVIPKSALDAIRTAQEKANLERP